MTTLIKTDKSFLTTHRLPKEIVMEDCIQDVCNKLHIRPEIMLYGKIVSQNRDVGFFSNTSAGYMYSGKLMHSQPLTPSLTKLLDVINTLFNAQFNGILINRYDNGNNYIGAHSDSEIGIDPVGVVAISYGSVRKFRIRNKATKEIVQDIPTISGEIMCMGGEFQKEFTYEIPVEKKVQCQRYSFTFRKHNV